MGREEAVVEVSDGGSECIRLSRHLLLHNCHNLLHFVSDKIGALVLPLSVEGKCSAC